MKLSRKKHGNYRHADQLKAVDLVRFCERCYGMQFQRKGHVFMCLSPFGAEQEPSFVVHQKNGQWLFKDFSSGKGGSIIDLVRELDGMPNDYATTVARIETLLNQHSAVAVSQSREIGLSSPGCDGATAADLSRVYSRIQSNAVEPARSCLESRHISGQVLDELLGREQLLTNVYGGKSYCCFAVRDAKGQLMCLDNHQIGGPEKFVLGNKHVFVPDYDALAQAQEVTITEGIIDLLSMQTMCASIGLALLGTALDFPAEFIAGSQKIVLALDNDEAGDAGTQKLRARFSDKQVENFSVGDYKDPNEILGAVPNIATKRKKFSPEQKLEIYQAWLACQNKSQVAREFDIDRSYLSELIAESQQAVVAHFSGKKAGRKKADQPSTLRQAVDQIDKLETDKLQLAKAREELHISNEFLKLRLAWAEGDQAEKTRRHFKKKRRNKR